MLCLVWGTSWLVIKIGLQDIPPFTGAALRFVIAGTCMIGVARMFSAREGGGRPPVSVVIAHGVCQFALNYGLVYVCQTVIPSGMVALIWAVFPLFIALGEHFVIGTQRLSGPKWLGIVVSFLGTTDFREWTDGRYVMNFQYVRDGWGFANVLHAERFDADFDATEIDPEIEEAIWDDAYWALWKIDLENETAEPFDAVGEVSAYGWGIVQVDSRTFMTVPHGDSARTKIYELDDEGGVTEHLDVEGDASFIRVR